MRELTFAAVHHPQFIDGGEWMLVDHPTVRPLQKGAPDLGWEGDERLAVYLHQKSKTFVLWRLEAGGEYMPVSSYGVGEQITPATVNETIRGLIRTDSRRGFNPLDDVADQMAKAEAVQQAEHRERISQTADKLLYGLSKSHLPGVEVPYRRNLLAD